MAVVAVLISIVVNKLEAEGVDILVYIVNQGVLFGVYTH
jgi:hypothetical protein